MAKVLPSTFRKLVATKITNKFREAVEAVTVPLLEPGPKEVIIRNRYAGINASDINVTAARYDPSLQPPFDVGFEGIGEVVAAGSQCRMKTGQPVGYVKFGAFSEYVVLPEKMAMPLPTLKPEFIPLLVSGMTAAISLDKLGDLKQGEKVLVTAAAGGTGQFAVQLAKAAGCHVIGTCSTDEKVQFLKDIGCDRPINYSKENLNDVLKKEYPKGIDVVYESIGGEVFDTCIKRLAVKGRLIVIGYISGYESATGFKPSRTASLPAMLLPKSASVRGFFLNDFTSDWLLYIQKLAGLYTSGDIKCHVDNGKTAPTGPFKGLDSICDAVEYMYTKKNIGKIIVDFPDTKSNL